MDGQRQDERRLVQPTGNLDGFIALRAAELTATAKM